MKSCICVRKLVRYGVECLDGGDGRDDAVYDSSNDSGLLARGEVSVGGCLG